MSTRPDESPPHESLPGESRSGANTGTAGVEGDRQRVFIDARWTRIDAHDGISRFGACLAEALHRLHPVTMLIHDERQLALLPDGVPHLKINSPMSVREVAVSRRLDALGADVVFSPMQVIGGFRRRYRLVLTLHDLIYYRHPQPPGFLPWPVRVLWRIYHKAYWPQRVLLNRGDAVVTVSETTRRLIERHRLTRRPVTVVHNAPSGLPEVSGPEAGGSDGARDLVYMGSFMPYKDVETLIAGMRSLPGHRLHLLSRIPPAREAELRRLVPDGTDVVFWRGIAEADYRCLLSRAAALVTASRDEGFGLPLIEAMHCGTPVVCSDLDIFREVTGGHARFFAPGDAEAFAAAVREVTEPAVRADLAHRGREQAQRFSWDRSARRLLEVLVPGSPRPDLDGAGDEV